MRISILSLIVALVAFGPAPLAFGIVLGQVDDFQDGTVQGWEEGGPSPNPPFNLTDGGPGGVGDHALRNVASGSGSAGSKMIQMNEAQWTGDYLSAGVDSISMLMRNDPTSAGNLFMRVAIHQTAGADWYASTNHFDLPNDGQWYPVTFELNAASLTQLAGTDPLANVLADVDELRILHSTAPNFRGGVIPATLDIDNIRAIPEPASGVIAVCGCLSLLIGGRRRRQS
jgi:hypothetical protein